MEKSRQANETGAFSEISLEEYSRGKERRLSVDSVFGGKVVIFRTKNRTKPAAFEAPATVAAIKEIADRRQVELVLKDAQHPLIIIFDRNDVWLSSQAEAYLLTPGFEKDDELEALIASEVDDLDAGLEQLLAEELQSTNHG